MNRWFEIRLRELECLYSLQSMTAGTAYPAAVFEKLWKSVLKNQFHDIIPGSSIKEVYQDYRNEALACQKQLHALTTALETEEQQLRIINTAAWQRTSIIAVVPGTVPEHKFSSTVPVTLWYICQHSKRVFCRIVSVRCHWKQCPLVKRPTRDSVLSSPME